MENLNETANNLLKRNLEFVSDFSSQRLDEIKSQILEIERELKKRLDPQDRQRLIQSLKIANDMYSQLLEQSTVLFMGSVKPLANILEHEARQAKTIETTSTTVENAETIENESERSSPILQSSELTQLSESAINPKLSQQQIYDLYKPYED